MKILNEEHKKLLLKIANEWSFKAFVLTYSEEQLYSKLLHKTDEYSEEEAEEMNVVGQKWIDYHHGKFDHKMPKQWADFKQSKL